MSALTGRATIVYASAWMETKTGVDPVAHQITLADMQGFMEAVSGVSERELDLFLHSPGGSAEGAESILEYLRTQFDHIRVIVPMAAMSAATMLALGADEIAMGSYSQLGPIDPQFTVQTPEGPRSAPGQAIVDQFELAKEECQDPAKLPAWLPILRGYLPGLIAQCGHSLALAQQLVETWLTRYMFAGFDEPERTQKAKDVAKWFSDFQRFKSHGRRVGLEDAERQGLTIVRLEDQKELQEAVLSVHHAFRLTLSQTPTTKIIENHNGRAYIEMAQQIPVLLGPPGTQPRAGGGSPSNPPTLGSPNAPAPKLSRQQIRQQQRESTKRGGKPT
jgi:hypothetical protein